MDTPKYESKVNTKISKLKNDSINENYSLTQTIEKTMEILNDSTKQCSNQRKYGKNKLKLNIWNNDIKIVIKQNKLAHKQWKEAGNQSVQNIHSSCVKLRPGKSIVLKLEKKNLNENMKKGTK